MYPIILNVFLLTFVEAEPSCNVDSHLIENMLKNHNKRKVPLDDGDPVQVTVELWVQDVSRIIETSSEFELDVYITEQWGDKSLSFDNMNPCKSNLSLDATVVLKKIWQPGNIFVNSKNASLHVSPYENVFLMIYANGTVWVNYRIKLTGPCKKDFASFPIDRQHCTLLYQSLSHNIERVVMEWTLVGVSVLKTIQLPDYALDEEIIEWKKIQKLETNGIWDQLVVTFVFQRLYGFYILQAYVPAYISVFISWVSFYLGPKSVAPRTTVGVSSLLAVTFQFGSIIQDLPRTPDVKAIDVWALSCMGFIFCSLLELAIVGYLGKYDKEIVIDCRCSIFCLRCPIWTATRIDGISMLLFPSFFLLFNIYYWGIYLGGRS